MRMREGLMAVLLLATATLAADWGNEWAPMESAMPSRRSVDTKDAAGGSETEVQGRYLVHESIQSNSTSEIDTIIEQLLNSRREGRNLGEYDAVYADGNIDQALQQGNDMQARNLIRDKLCGLGLMSCEIEEKRPFYSTIYAQGPPPPSGYSGGPYGPAKPMPPPGYFGGRPPMGPPPSSLNSFGPPRKVGYEGPYKPMSGPYRPSGPGGQFGGQYLEHPPPSAIDGSLDGITYTKPPPGALIYDSKPPGPIYQGGPNGGPVYNGPSSNLNSNSNGLPPYNYENPEGGIQGSPSSLNGFYSSQQSSSSSSAATSSSTKVVVGAPIDAGLQQHVHHHYHHVEGTEGVKVPSVPIPISSGQTINTDFSALAQSSATYTPQASSSGSYSQSNAFNAGFNGASQGGLLSQGAQSGFSGLSQKPGLSGDIYKPNSGLSSFGGNSGGFGQNGFGSSPSSSYHSQNPDYYKKELQTGASNNYNGISGGYQGQGQGQYQGQGQGGYDTSRQQIVDCQCVPFNQCPAADRIGRKEDLILPIDPRNLGKDIEALSEDAPAGNATAKADTKKDEKQDKDEKKRTRRQAISDDQKDQDDNSDLSLDAQGRAYYGNRPVEKTCRANEVCCRRPVRPQAPPQQQLGRCGVRNAAGITGRIKNPVYVDGDSEFGEYPWHVAILKKDPKESIYACGGTLIDAQHIISAAHCIKSQNGFDLRVRLGEWDVNHDVEFFPYIERDVVSVHIHPEYYAGTLDNDLAILKLDQPVDFTKNPHISPACLPDKYSDFTGARCWTTGWGKDAFGEHGKYQNILKEVDVPILSHHQCEAQLRNTRLGYSYKLNPGFVCAGGEEGKDACKGDGGGPLVCERNGVWNVVGVVSWGIGCGQVNVPGVYVKVSSYLPWIQQITQSYQ
ncbi:uncharacterized protein LOC117588921 isoform X2 [Drosophila guanche]|uniref:Phenoloxidase-activating factor 2 n=1 Tax=Drosophila guanche TaxID=7266 RepID=A0A3B0JYC8_DROGU|nr:uncharacterized protein LOC117588921 isoform X2 [Drosophila guanche]SPP87065.1 blast:Serine proteinase stubble [Drosophila guanche]